MVAHLAAAALLSACGGDDGPKGPPLPVGPTPPGGGVVTRAVTVTSGLEHPWGLAFLPDGRMLVTERPGRMRIVSADGATVSTPLAGLPAVHAAGQGGLLDVAIDPDFATTPWVYWSYAEDGVGGSGTAVARGLLNGTTLDNVQVIFRQLPKVAVGDIHFGSRLVFANDKTLFVTLGERGTDDPAAPTLRQCAEPHQPPRQGGAHQPRRLGCRRTTPTSARPARGPRSGASATATRRARR